METNKMAFKMGMTKEDLSGPKPVPNGLYELQVTGFRPKIAKSGTSLNYNAEFTITGNPLYENRKVFHPLNTSFSVAIRDFVHATGLELETITVPGDADTPQHERQILPGTFENAAQFPDDPSKWGKYIGPLTNKIFKAELVTTTYQGKDKNEIRCFFCAVPDCAVTYPDIKHSQNLIKG
jgi:hypothetical protein